jgi:hypothetical protein
MFGWYFCGHCLERASIRSWVTPKGLQTYPDPLRKSLGDISGLTGSGPGKNALLLSHMKNVILPMGTPIER